MELTIRLSPEQERRLSTEADRAGIGIEEVVTHLLDQRLPTGGNEAARALLNAFAREDETDDPHELAARRGEWDELKTALDANRTSARALFPDSAQ